MGQKSESPQRLWWLAAGVFACLPIHAAGIYDQPEVECIGDYVVSSFIPTLGTLLTPVPEVTAPPKMVVIIDPVSLGNATAELKKIEQYVPTERLVKLGTREAPANEEDVLSCLQSTSIAHFACHGIQDAENPLNSTLYLRKSQVKSLESKLGVSSLMRLSLRNSSLVFLSACETAMGGGELPDESRHLAATFLFCGFRGAVGTMWCVG